MDFLRRILMRESLIDNLLSMIDDRISIGIGIGIRCEIQSLFSSPLPRSNLANNFPASRAMFRISSPSTSTFVANAQSKSAAANEDIIMDQDYDTTEYQPSHSALGTQGITGPGESIAEAGKWMRYVDPSPFLLLS